jgi:phosphoribosylformylglycinamidine synthase
VRIGVVTFPGSLDDRDAQRAVRLAGGEPVALWHGSHDLDGVDAIVLPGGFSYGDYLRCGAIAARSPIMAEVISAAESGMPVLGICNGFQILCEVGLLPGALIANRDLAFICRFVDLEVTDTSTVLTRGTERGQRIRIPLNSYEGNWVDPTNTGRIALRYVDDPNGSQHGAAAVANEKGNVVGVMPHPERGVEELLGSSDGRFLLEGFLHSLVPA